MKKARKRNRSETRLTEAHTRHKRRNREAESTDAPERGGLLRSSDEAGYGRGAKGAGHRRWDRVNRQREEPGRRQPSCGDTSRMNREVHVRNL